MRLTALVADPDHVCCRYRLAAFRPHLSRAGHRLDLCPLPRLWWSRLAAFRALRQADVVILQRKLLQRWQLHLLRRAAPILLFDFDDAVFLRDSYAAKGLVSAGRRRRFQATLRAADAILAGNAFLAAQALAERRPDRVHILPTCVEPGRYPLAAHSEAGVEVELVWIGSASTLPSLEAIQPWLEETGRRQPGLRLKLVCDRFLRLRRLPVRARPWTEAEEAAELAAADIGISWLPDDLWSRGKCGLKVLQYMAAGLPVVANPVGVHLAMVRPGENGFLVETSEQWHEAVGRLAADPGLRRRMGRAGRRLVELEYSVSAGAARWLTLLDGLQSGRHAA